MLKYFYASAICALLVFVVGCGQNVRLGGKVTFSDDDSPLTCGRVYFHKDGFEAFGDLKEDGSYVIGSLKEKDGLPPGTYQIYINGAERATGILPGGDALTESLIDKKYTRLSTSDLTLEVTPKTNRFDFQVDRF